MRSFHFYQEFFSSSRGVLLFISKAQNLHESFKLLLIRWCVSGCWGDTGETQHNASNFYEFDQFCIEPDIETNEHVQTICWLCSFVVYQFGSPCLESLSHEMNPLRVASAAVAAICTCQSFSSLNFILWFMCIVANLAFFSRVCTKVAWPRH